MGGIQDPRSTLEATIPIGCTRTQDRDPRRWRYLIQKHYIQARRQVNDRLKDVIVDRAERHNEGVRSHSIKTGSQVWLYLDRVKEGYARKLAHLWYGPFRVTEKINEYPLKLEIDGTEYHLFPIADRLEFDETPLPEDSWTPNLSTNEYEVERFADMRTERRTRYGRTYREFQVYWKGYEEPSWVDEAELNCGTLQHEFLRNRANRNRFSAMQSHEE
ncbi:unnamed protein product [Phytophthora fragariaefolia]|uniref:Unnamed protein product n=1 Tax=Phytophthora fragariaefolia TaxID=1490495 RepID=A0A9W7D2C6_9STRA|nr:unnamed protein product [Phytophthora fragariaefolia]